MYTAFDIIIFSIIAFSSLISLYYGLVSILIWLLSFISSIVLSILFYPKILDMVGLFIKIDGLKFVISCLTSYILALFISILASSKLNAIFSEIQHSYFNKILGLFFGVICGIGVSVFLFFITALFFTAAHLKNHDIKYIVNEQLLVDHYPKWLQNSTSTKYLQNILISGINYVPDDIVDKILHFNFSDDIIDINDDNEE